MKGTWTTEYLVLAGTSLMFCYVTQQIIIIIIKISAMWKQNTVQVIPIVIQSTGVIPKSPSQSLKRQLASKYIYTNAKICNSWNMFNCNKLSKL
jgi:hypothetical protein